MSSCFSRTVLQYTVLMRQLSLMQQRVYQTKIQNVDELRQRLLNLWSSIEQDVIDACHASIDQWRVRLKACVCSGGGRVDLKIAVLVFQCLTGQAPGYLAEDCQLVADVSARRLRSADTATCVTRRTSNIFDDRCFAAAGPRLWNSLPINLRQCHCLEQFKRLLKTFLFSA